MATEVEKAPARKGQREIQEQEPQRRAPESYRYATPLCDIWEDMEGATIAVDLPGVGQDGLELRVEEGVLLLTAHASVPELPGRALYTEWVPTHFHRSFALAPEVDRDQIEATLANGVLTVRIPKAEAARPRRVEVRSR